NEFQVGAIRPDGAGAVRVTGAVGRAVGRREIEVPVVDPTELFARCLLWNLDAAGLGLSGAVAVEAGAAAALEAPVELAAFETPLGNAVVVANKESDNSIADHLFKVLGATAGGEGSFAGGERAVLGFLEQPIGTPTAGLVLRDGSGLSHRNRITARAMTAVLAAMANAEPAARDAFLRSLPVAGVDGSLEERLRDPPYAGSVRAKTGYISGASSLSGYARTRGGRTLAFSILINDFGPKQTNQQMKAIQDDLCRAFVDLW
ncbi:MAG TPA: D-alanyl-D-alanine carboxypeptidase/D-alanyl-D-alanine-endopeptidase, partial [Planctomycetota bacterium]|nr:D-alanyl-D-alanine carboxypeptidase/D-alanyl-D-alanine-endopeptidase [Planctomycetota bacterium]